MANPENPCGETISRKDLSMTRILRDYMPNTQLCEDIVRTSKRLEEFNRNVNPPSMMVSTLVREVTDHERNALPFD